MADTGLGATLTLATTGSVGTIRSITSPEFTLEKIDTSALSTTDFMTYIAGDLTDPGEITAEVIFDATADDLPSRGVAETVTITWPIHTSGNTTNATLAGTGFITGWKMPDMAVNELQVASITIAYDGGTGPAFSQEAA